MRTVTVKATKDFEYHGQRIASGRAVVMRPIDAAIAARRGEVTLTRGLDFIEPEPEPVTPRRRRRRRTSTD